MSWLLNYYSERLPQNDNVIAKLRLATKEETEEELVKQSKCNCLAKINKVINYFVVPIIFKLRYVADLLTRKSPEFVHTDFTAENEFFTRNTIAIKEILRPHRRDLSEEGIFSHSRISNRIGKLANLIFSPDGLLPIDINDNMLICDKQFHEVYRDFLDQFFSQISIKRHIPSIEAIIDKTLLQLETKGNVFLNDKIKVLAITVMANIFLGIDESLDAISSATSNIIPWITDDGAMESSQFYRFIVHFFPNKKFISDDAKKVTSKVLSEAITEAVTKARSEENSKTIVGEMLRENFSLTQIQSMIMTLFVAGQDNVSTTTTHSLLKMAQDLELQSAIRNDTADPLKSSHIIALLSESLRVFCPIGGLGRIAGQNLVFTLTNKKTGDLVSKTFIQKNAGVNASIIFAGKDPSLFSSPSVFDPERFKGAKSLLPGLKHMPFGHGPHKCPGWYLFHVIAALTISKIAKNYTVTTPFEGEPRMRVGFVSGIDEKLPVSFKKLGSEKEIGNGEW